MEKILSESPEGAVSCKKSRREFQEGSSHLCYVPSTESIHWDLKIPLTVPCVPRRPCTFDSGGAWPPGGTEAPLVAPLPSLADTCKRPQVGTSFGCFMGPGGITILILILMTNSAEILKMTLYTLLSTTYPYRTLLEGIGRLWWLFPYWNFNVWVKWMVFWTWRIK